MKSKVNLYSIADCKKEIQIHVTCENRINIESYLFRTRDVCFVEVFNRWLHENVNQSFEELEIILNGENNTIFSLYFDLRKTQAKVKLAKNIRRNFSNINAA